jgi:hypothetical protein
MPATTSTMTMKGMDPSDRDQVDGDGVVRRGDELSSAVALSIADVVAQSGALAGKRVKVMGVVDSVCMKKGCWFVLKDGERTVRITSKGYKFFVPAGSPGMKATVEGELEVATVDQATAQHYEDEKAMGTGAPAKKVDGPRTEIAIAAVGLEMTRGG